MSSSARLQINPEIVSETIQGEVVAIDLKTGCYYSLIETAADVWALLQYPASVADMVDVLSARYGAELETVESAVARFIDSLQADNLIVQVAETGPASARDAQLPPVAAGTVFTAPELQKFADMQDLLKIDPIHEVGEAGWPIKAPPPSKI